MNIILTGATGFLGSHLLKRLVQEGHCVMAWKRSTSDLSAVKEAAPHCQWFSCDTMPLDASFQSFPADAVIHCATVYGRGGAAGEVVEGNLQLPVRLLETAARMGCPYFLNTSSFFCKQLPERLVTHQPLYLPEYTLSKYQFAQWGALFANQGKLSFVNLQLEHVYGEGDRPGKFIPWLTEQFSRNVPSVDLSDGTQMRDFVPVEVVADAYMQVLADLPDLTGFHHFEIGTGTAVSLRSFVEALRDKLGASTQLRFGAIERKPEEIMFSVADKSSPYSLPNLLSRSAVHS